ncbi:MAG: hypothetical protein EOO39_41915 [Cytophagaceae bacterium]|nr:MAG: hypothetical protein EOO39_41915 [Cytophagaceae bacterium]
MIVFPLNCAVPLASIALLLTLMTGKEITQHAEGFPARLPASSWVGTRPLVQSDSTKKQSVKLRAKPVQPVKQASETRYSAPGHYTVTVPRDNTPGGKVDLILVNGKRQVDRIGDVDSNTIESIELLKDTKSIAKYKLLYGEKAAKGIVIIHLKGTNTL